MLRLKACILHLGFGNILKDNIDLGMSSHHENTQGKSMSQFSQQELKTLMGMLEM